jgi:membrane protein YdbS with pleckstrin-like domain
MYVSYALAVPLLAVLALGIAAAFPAWSLNAVLAGAVVLALPLVPALFRYSRVLWMHLDRTIDRSP